MKTTLGLKNTSIQDLASFAHLVARKPSGLKVRRSLITHVTIDSREAGSGCLFIALPGTRTDGHDFIPDAIGKGSPAVMIQEEHLQRYAPLLDATGTWAVVVPHVLTALQDMARGYMASVSHARIIGITGSCGKTTTKEMLASILAAQEKTVKTPGNYNSLLGLPLSLMQMGPDDQYGVFEMGIDHDGEMEQMVSMVKPDYALLTNIGISHAEKLGSVDAIVREKSRLLQNAQVGYFIGQDEPKKKAVAELAGSPLGMWGQDSIDGLTGVKDLGIWGWKFQYQGKGIHLPAIGRHSLVDACAALSVASYLGIAPDAVKSGLENIQIPAGRSRVVPGHVTVIEDYYNAATASTESILDFMAHASWRGHKKVVLGDMKELGRYSTAAHEMVGRRLLGAAPASAFLYGSHMEKTWQVLKRGGYSGTLVYSDDAEEMNTALKKNIEFGDLVLVKGSRSMAMEKFIPAITEINHDRGEKKCYA